MASSRDETPFDYVRYIFCDILGRSRGRIVPAREFQNFKSGVGLYGGTICTTAKDTFLTVNSTKINKDFQEPVMAVPDSETLHKVPWAGNQEFKVVDILCETRWVSDMTPQLACPRYVANKQLDNLHKLGFKLLSGFEMEFSMQDPNNRLSEYRYLDNGLHTKYSSFLYNVESMMHRAGVQIESLHSEHDPSLFEMVLKAQQGITSADAAFVFQSGIQEMKHPGDLKVSFDSKGDKCFVGKHFNHSLWSNGENVFKSVNKEFCELGKHWLAGLLLHARALSAIFSPTRVCYERLNNPTVPNGIYWDTYDRSCCVKLKESPLGSGTYLENRMPSGLSNPYLVLAATVAAGLDGVQRKLTCPPAGRDNIVGKLPGSLSEAVEELVADTVLVEALGQEFVQCFVATVTHKE